MGYVDNLEPRMRAILKDADLSTVSAKAIRKKLIAEGEDEGQIKAYKAAIDEKIGEIYEELAGAVEDDLPVKTRDSPAEGHPASSQPEPLVDRKPKAEDRGVTDAEMAARMQAEYDAMQVGRSRRTTTAAPKKAKKRKTKSASDLDSDGEPKKKKRGGGGGAFNAPLLLSDALAAFTGETQLSRPQVVKALWAHIKENDLQDSTDRRFILCDDRLKSVFHVDKLHMFTMNKLLGPHLRKPDDVIGAKSENVHGKQEIVDSDSE